MNILTPAVEIGFDFLYGGLFDQRVIRKVFMRSTAAVSFGQEVKF